MNRRPPRSTLFPSTTLFRSQPHAEGDVALLVHGDEAHARAEAGEEVELLEALVEHVLPRLGQARLDHHVVERHRAGRSEEHTSELQSRQYLVCRLLLEKKKI